MTPEIIRSCETCDWRRDTIFIKGGCCDPANDCSGLPGFDHWIKKQLTPAEEEKYVQSHWSSPHWTHIPGYGWVVQNYSDGMTVLASYLRTKKLATHAVYLFTVERKKQIARRERGIGLLKEVLPGDVWHDAEEVVIAGEILACEQAALAEMKKGWRE